jgi:hypothetical protein
MSPSSSMANNIFEVLSLRYQFEKIVSFRKAYDLPNYNSDIDSLYYFVTQGAKNNRFRKNYEEAMRIARDIIKSYENEKTNISSVHGKEK